MGGGIGGDAAAAGAGGSPSSAGSSGAKRGRDPEDEVYLDNLHSSKRYLSQIMATSLNGLSFGDAIDDGLMESSPARSENLFYLRDEISSQYSPMSEDSDECRFYDPTFVSTISHTSPQIHENPNIFNCPGSPHRLQKPITGNPNNCPSISNAYTLPCNSLSAVICSPTRRESEGRFPSSPNDMCHAADLRKTALLRSVQMRTHNDLHLNQGQEINGGSELEESSEKVREYDEDDGI